LLPSWLGDTVMAEPALRAVHAALPSTSFALLGRPGLAEVLEGTGLAERSIEHDMRGLRGPFAAARAAGQALGSGRAASLDILILPNSARSALTARLVAARRRIGYATDLRRCLLSDAIAPPSRKRPISAVDWYASLIERAFSLRVTDRRPQLTPTAAQHAAAAQALARLPRPIALLNPGANRPDKRWPAERFVEVGCWLRQQGAAVVVSGGPGEAALTRVVAEGCGGVDLASRAIGLGGLLGVMAQCDLLITNDTGPRHLAIAVGTPTVALFGPTDPRWALIPGADEIRLLAEPFLAEDLVADRFPKACRVDRIEVHDVITAAARLLATERGGVRLTRERSPAAPGSPPDAPPAEL